MPPDGREFAVQNGIRIEPKIIKKTDLKGIMDVSAWKIKITNYATTACTLASEKSNIYHVKNIINHRKKAFFINSDFCARPVNANTNKASLRLLAG